MSLILNVETIPYPMLSCNHSTSNHPKYIQHIRLLEQGISDVLSLKV